VGGIAEWVAGSVLRLGKCRSGKVELIDSFRSQMSEVRGQMNNKGGIHGNKN
jgi:hypothetical protein